jgi:aldose 1-epimerase
VILATGEPIELSTPRSSARIGTVAAVLRGLVVDGHDLVQPIPDDVAPPFGNGTVLVPWPNRVRDGRWTLDGAVQQLDITEPSRGNALHGLLAFTDYEVRERSADAVTLGALIPPQHGWPFTLDSWVRYELLPDGLRVTHGAENLGDAVAPWAVGTHPFLRVGTTPVEELTLTAPAASYVDVDERLNPIGMHPVDGTPADLRGGPVVAGLDLDTAYGDIAHADVRDGRGASAWLTAPDGSRTVLRQDLGWHWLQVFTTREYPTPDGAITAIAIEPMTAPPDALNSGEGLVRLAPGETWQGGWELRRETAA